MIDLKIGLLAAACVFGLISCKSMQPALNVPGGDPTAAASPTPTPTPTGGIGNTTSKRAFHIEGNIDEARQAGDVCDTSVEFTVPGTLKFKFTPADSMKGTYTYTGPFNAKGSGPYEIREDGTMLLDGTGCIMGKCATYSHNWKATKIDPAACKDK